MEFREIRNFDAKYEIYVILFQPNLGNVFRGGGDKFFT
jgi:hypothetical protein